MEIKSIVKDTSKSLREKCKEVAYPYSKEDIETAKYLHEYLVFASKEENQEKYNLRAGVGLAAPQIGINKRMIGVYIEYPNEEGKVEKVIQYSLINPKLISHSLRKAYLVNGEGCLSVEKEHEGYVVRSAIITVKGFDALTNSEVELKLRGYEAIVFQHELDHLDGILFYDRINKNNPFEKIEGALEL